MGKKILLSIEVQEKEERKKTHVHWLHCNTLIADGNIEQAFILLIRALHIRRPYIRAYYVDRRRPYRPYRCSL